MGLRDFVNILLDTVFPTGFRCTVCGRELEEFEEYGICPSCGIPWNDGHRCLHCDRPLDNEADYCEQCLHSANRIVRIRSALIYTGSSRRLIRGLKFGRARYMMESIEPILRRALKSWNDPVDFIIPVPLSGKNLGKRGYNQAELLAAVVADCLGAPVLSCLQKVRDVGDQARLNKAGRFRSVQDCFEFSGETVIAGKSVLIVDDVRTTGATLEECARVLAEREPASIFAYVLATGRNRIRLR